MFFPLSIKEELEMESEEQEQYGEDGYSHLTNDWYDMPGGQNYIYWEKNSRYRKETE